ncbi:hypothetical protein ACFQ60_02085 [Streptomyces zhihengii]|uniref:Uncharacterized protein n=1 Tax=Streptomyces zhihengii TaxID=1818004 RepID=A0ABS2V3L4_9ACTN|nr:hypothetical protein [Streptomyces zhihengii]MBM9624178.1 hypothetical protein [Streptomyces zhihengii]
MGGKFLPWFEDPLVFLPDPEQMEWQSRSMDMFADDPLCVFFPEAQSGSSVLSHFPGSTWNRPS